jgi:glycosyltransferase involved in cell wall biosynthesis
MTPKVSVCIPTYNREKYLKEALESVFSQSFKDYEVVVVDDGSIDGTEQMIKDAGFSVRYYWMNHIGKAAARNKLIELAQGEFLSFLDSDDLLFPDTLERLMRVIDQHGNNVFAYGSHVGIDENGNKIHIRQPRELPRGKIVSELFESVCVKTCGTLGAKRIFEQVGGFDNSLQRCEVYKLFLEVALRYEFIPVDGPTYKKRRHGGNLADRSFVGRTFELNMLEDFYFNCGGKEIIPRYRAMKRLSEEGYRAGRAAMREGLPEQACKLLSKSFRRHPNVKSLIHWIRVRRQKQQIDQPEH